MSLFKRFLHFFIRAKEEGERRDKGFCQLLEYIPEGTNLLDVGCAEGKKALRYAEILSVPQENIYGIEIQEKCIKIASGKLNISIMDLEKNRFPFTDETFDVVTCNQVFEHLKNIFLPHFRLMTITGSSLYPLFYPVVEFGARLFPGLSAYTFYLLRKVKHNLQASSWRISSIGDTCL